MDSSYGIIIGSPSHGINMNPNTHIYMHIYAYSFIYLCIARVYVCVHVIYDYHHKCVNVRVQLGGIGSLFLQGGEN